MGTVLAYSPPPPPLLSSKCWLYLHSCTLSLPLLLQELEDTLLLDCAPTPSALLVELFCTFLNGIVDKDITSVPLFSLLNNFHQPSLSLSPPLTPCSEDNWPFFLKLHIEWRCEYLKEKWNPFSDNKEYKDLSIRQRVEILHKLCHWRLELDDIADLFRVRPFSTFTSLFYG